MYCLIALALALTYSTPMMMIGQYFEKRRVLASGIALAGASVGNFVYPSVYRYLFDNMDFRHAMVILGGIMLNACWCGALLRPVSFYRRSQTTLKPTVKIHNFIYKPLNGCDDAQGSDIVRTQSLEHIRPSPGEKMRPRAETIDGANPAFKPKWKTASPEIRVGSINEIAYLSRMDIAEGEAVEEQQANTAGERQTKSCLQVLKRLWYLPTPTGQRRPVIDFSLMVDPYFLGLFVSVFCASSSYLIGMLAVVAHVDDLGYSKHQGAMTVSFMGAADLFGRVGLMAILETKQLRQHKTMAYGVYMMTASVFMLLIAFNGSYIYISVMAGGFRFFCGTMYPLMPILLIETLGQAKLPNTFGLIIFAQALSAIICISAGILICEIKTFILLDLKYELILPFS